MAVKINTSPVKKVTQRHRRTIWSLILLLVIGFIANLSAIIDAILHPEIGYFDLEHIIMGLSSALIVGTLFTCLIIYFERLNAMLHENREAKKNFSDSESRYNLLAENISDVIWVMDLDTRQFRYISPSIIHLRGFTVEEAMKQTIEESLTESSVQKVYTTIPVRRENFLKEGPRSYTDIVEQKCKDGSTVWVEIKSRYMISEETGHIEIYGVSRNIDERQRTEKILRESEEKFHSLFETSLDGILITSPDGRIYAANPSACRMIERTEEEIKLLGRNGIVDITDVKLSSALEMRNQSGHFSGEIVFIKKNGNKFIGEVSSSVYLDKNGNILSSIVFRDITERKKTEEALHEKGLHLQHAEQFARFGHWQFSLDEKIMRASGSALNLYGFSQNEVPLSVVQSVVLPEYRTLLDDTLRGLIEHSVPYDVEFKIRRKSDGDIIDIHSKAEYDPKTKMVFGIVQDITERKKVEEALRESEEQYRSLFNANKDGISIFCINEDETISPIIIANKTASEMLGYTEQEIIGKHPTEFEIPENAEILKQRMEDLKTKGVSSFETQLLHKNGNHIQVEINVRPIKINNKPALMNIVRDISEQKRIENALQVSEEKFSNAFYISPDAISLTRLSDGRYVDVNKSFIDMSGYSREELINKTSLEMNLWENPEDRVRVFTQIRENGETLNQEIVLCLKNKKKMIGSISSRIIDINGETFILSIIRDITEQKKSLTALRESEEKYRSLVENSPDAIAIYVDGRVVFVNNQCAVLMGVQNKEELLGRSVIEFVHPDNRSRVIERMKQVAVDGKPLPTEEEKFIRSDGTAVDVEVKAIPTMYGDKPAVQIIVHDITERKQMEKALRENEEIFNQFMEHSPIYVFFKDENIRAKRLSRNYETMLGRPIDQLLGKNMYDLFPSDLAKNIVADDMQILNEGKKVEVEEELNGCSYFTIKYPINIEGKPRYLAGFTIDITERKSAERSLIESENNYRALIQNMKVGIVVHNPDTSILMSNPMASQLLGLSKNQMMGKTAIDPAWCFTRDDGSRLPLEEYPVNRVLNSIEPVSDLVLGIIRTERESPIWVQCAAHQKREMNGDVQQIIVTFFDITDRKNAEDALRESEKRFRKILQDVQTVAVQGYAPDGTTQYWNEASVRLYGYTEEEAIGRNLLDLIIPPEMRNGVEQAMKEMAVTGVPIPASELSLMRKDGTLVSVFSSHTIVQIPGRPQELFCIDVDLTERKHSEEALRNAQKLESIGTLAGGIAHDFNNLLGAMMGNISLAQARISPDHPSVKNIERAMSAMERAATLTKQMLAYSGKGKFQIREIDLCSLVQEHINLFEVSLPKNVQLISKLFHAPVFIKGDPGQIDQIVMNLIINGGEAIGTKQGTVSIEISPVTLSKHELVKYGLLTNSSLKEGTYALLQVTDNGSGMSKETQEKIFDPFFTTKFVGRGLGLSAVLGIIRANEGGIAIDTTEGKGTTFRVLLPLIQSSEPENSTPTIVNLLPIIENIMVLVIDDEPYVAEMAVDILESGEYKHVAATDPEKGIMLFREQWRSIDLVILDYSMPKMNGKEVFIEMRKINPEVKVIISSGYTEEEIFELMGDDMPNGFIQKPYTQENLLSMIKRILESA